MGRRREGEGSLSRTVRALFVAPSLLCSAAPPSVWLSVIAFTQLCHSQRSNHRSLPLLTFLSPSSLALLPLSSLHVSSQFFPPLLLSYPCLSAFFLPIHLPRSNFLSLIKLRLSWVENGSEIKISTDRLKQSVFLPLGGSWELGMVLMDEWWCVQMFGLEFCFIFWPDILFAVEIFGCFFPCALGLISLTSIPDIMDQSLLQTFCDWAETLKSNIIAVASVWGCERKLFSG